MTWSWERIFTEGMHENVPTVCLVHGTRTWDPTKGVTVDEYWSQWKKVSLRIRNILLVRILMKMTTS